MTETSGAEVLDAEREAAGYNQSIYLMGGMPYLRSVGSFSWSTVVLGDGRKNRLSAPPPQRR